jgi:hypothetical protein
LAAEINVRRALMIKKSLKAGSILVLLFSLLFFIGCSNGTTDTEPDRDDTPVVNPPDTPVVVEPRVTKVTILPGDIEVGRGESYTFTAEVEGVGAYDPAVTWTLDAVEAGEEPLLNTAISQRGKLTLDAGLHVGRDVRVVATAGGVSGLAVVTVAPEGPYFTWEPSRVKVAVGGTLAAALNGDPVYGYLRGYSHAEKDIRLRVGLLEEGVDYSVTYENGVSGARPTTGNPILQVVGTTTPYEGIVVALDASRITLLDPTLTGIIRVTMLSGAFFGSDKAELNPGRTSLVIEVSDHRAIDRVVDVDINFDGNEGPIQGAAARKGIYAPGTNPVFTLGANPMPSSLASVYWDYLSLAGNFAKRVDTPLVATVTFKALSGTYFLKSFNAAAISNSTSFIKGSPKVDKIEVSADGQTLTFELSYDVYAKILKDTGATGSDIELKTLPGFVANTYGFSPLIGAGDPAPTHTNSAPVLIFAENNYFDAKLEWGGTGIEAATEIKPASFKTTRPNKLVAEAKITLTPKIGYTFEGTDLTFELFAGTARILSNQTPTGTLVRGEEEGSLVLTLKYPVAEKVLGAADINAVNFEKLIARPIEGKSVGITGIGESVFKATDASPYTAQVAWDPGMQTTFYRFNAANASTTYAGITLTAKEGFAFDVSGGTSWSALGDVLASAVAIEPFSSDTITMPDSYTLKYHVIYDDSGTEYILKQITTLDGILPIDPIHGEAADPASGGNLSAGSSAEMNLTASTVSWTGLDSTDWKYGLTTKATIFLTAADGFTFKDYERLDDTFFNDVGSETTKKDYIENYFANGIYAGNTGGIGKVELVDGPWAAGNDIVFTLQYTIKPAEIDINGLTLAELGWWSDPVAAPNVIPIRFTTGVPVNFTVKRLLWESDDDVYKFADEAKQPNGSTSLFVGSGVGYQAKLILVPDTGYVFSPALTSTGGNEFETFHVDVGQALGWGNPASNVKPINIVVDIPASGDDEGNLVITLEFTPTP